MKPPTTVNEYCDLVDLMRRSGTELFLIEAPSNHYSPPPPKGYFGIRSQNRRLFLPLEDGVRYPAVDKLNDLINAKNFIESNL